MQAEVSRAATRFRAGGRPGTRPVQPRGVTGQQLIEMDPNDLFFEDIFVPSRVPPGARMDFQPTVVNTQFVGAGGADDPDFCTLGFLQPNGWEVNVEVSFAGAFDSNTECVPGPGLTTGAAQFPLTVQAPLSTGSFQLEFVARARWSGELLDRSTHTVSVESDAPDPPPPGDSNGDGDGGGDGGGGDGIGLAELALAGFGAVALVAVVAALRG